MFTAASIQPQLFSSSQLGPLWNAVRTTAQGIQWSKPSASSVSTSAKSNGGASHSKSTPLAVQLTKELAETLDSLGLHNLTPGLRVEELNPILRRPPGGLDSAYPTVQSSVSAATFFENRNGFPESMLLHSSYRERQPPTAFSVTVPALTSRGPLLRMPSPSVVHKLTRGFSSQRKESGDGVGMANTGTETGRLFAVKEMLRMNTHKKVLETESVKDIVQDIKVKDAEKNAIYLAAYRGIELNQEKNKKETKDGGRPRLATQLLVSLVLFYALYYVLQAVMSGEMRVNLAGKTYEVEPEDVNTHFDDVKGVQEAKQELMDIVEFLKNPDRFARLGARVPKGVLLVGPPGTGKTLMAKAVAGEADVPFFRASGAEFDEMFVGVGARKVRKLFAKAKERAPCVIFIDEIDSLAGKRSSSSIHPYANQTINQLLTEMDGFNSNAGVIVVAATNRRDHLDAAVLRPGRFDVEVRVNPPDVKGRAEILEYYLNKVKVNWWEVDVEKLARGTTGCTGADLENLVNQAAIKAALDDATEITQEHVEFAKDKVFMGPAKTKIQCEETNRSTAYHEAGHTIVAHYTKAATPLHKVTILPRGMSLGHTAFLPEKDQYGMSKAQLMAQMDVAMGGRLGEEIMLGQLNVTTGASSDFESATGIATAMVKQFGMSEKFGVRVVKEDLQDSGLSFLKVGELGPRSSDILDSEINRLIQESLDRARQILQDHSAEHKRLAEALIQYETLDKEEIQTVIKGKKLMRKEKILATTSSGDAGSNVGKVKTPKNPDTLKVPL